MTQTIEFKKASLLKRSLAILIDGFLLVLGFFLFLSLIIQPIVQHTTDYNSLYQQYVDVLLDSHLYEDTSSDGVASCSAITENYDENLTYYYTTYDNISSYNELKASSPSLFSYDEETETYKEIGSEDDLETFYVNALNTCLTAYNERENVQAAYLPVLRYSVIMCASSFVISVLLVNLLPSMLFKNGETLGYKVLGLKVISTFQKPQINKIQVLLRFLCLLFVELFLSLFTMFIPCLISFIMMISGKNRSSLNDYLTRTCVIDGAPDAKPRSESEIIKIEYDTSEQEKKPQTTDSSDNRE